MIVSCTKVGSKDFEECVLQPTPLLRLRRMKLGAGGLLQSGSHSKNRIKRPIEQKALRLT